MFILKIAVIVLIRVKHPFWLYLTALSHGIEPQTFFIISPSLYQLKYRILVDKSVKVARWQHRSCSSSKVGGWESEELGKTVPQPKGNFVIELTDLPF
jgi:hypothetical protein